VSRILIVDDDPLIVRMLSDVLTDEGYEVTTATQSLRAFDRAKESQPDLILMDIMMPEISGWEATRILRGNPQTKDIPVLAATVLFRPSDLQRCITAGCNDYIVKPFTVRQLRRKIEQLI
jgi:CheY-like chemotaxis protein